MKPTIVRETTKTVLPPEHNFALRYDEWEVVVFDNAIYYTVVAMRGRGSRERHQFQSLPDAIKQADGDDRACVYAVTKSGRAVCLDRSKWANWLVRYRVTHGLLKRRVITKKK